MQFPQWLVWYKKPDYRDIKEYSRAVGSGKRSLSPDKVGKNAVPSRLKLERVLENKTCSPMSLYDFYMYLKHIEYSPENLEFYIWFKNYEANYTSAKGTSMDETSSQETLTDGKVEDIAKDLAQDFPYDAEAAQETFARITELISSGAACSIDARGKVVCDESNKTLVEKEEMIREAELNAVVQAFLVPGGDKELNIPPTMRDQALKNLQNSSDPEHLRPIADHVYGLLRNCSHRNFVRLGVSNGTFETVCMATGLGIVLTAVGFLTVLLMCFVPFSGAHSRWEVFGAWPLWFVGMSLILSGLRGSCFFLLLFSRRQPLPWERFDETASFRSSKTTIRKLVGRLMIFDRKFRVKDQGLRQLQFKIVVQALIGGAMFASCCVILFIFLPVWSQTHL